MPGTLNWTPIPANPKQPAAAATFNARLTEFDVGIEAHFNGTAARHILAEIDSPTMDDHASTVALNVGSTDARTRVLQLLTLIGNLADKGRATDAFQAVAALTTDLKTVGAVLGGRTAIAGGGSLVQRGASAEIGVGYLTAYGFGGLDTPEVRARPVAGQVQPVVAVEDAAGATVLAAIYPTGLIYGGVNVQAKGQFVAGSGNRTITTPDGHLDAGQLAGTVAAAALPALTGDVTTPGGSVATAVAQVGGLAAASVASGAAAANAATSDAVANPGRIVKADAFGNFRAATITAALAGNAASASQVAATGIQGTVMAAQIDAAIARAANVPTNNGTGAVSGNWHIDIVGNAATATLAALASAVAAGAVGAAGIAPGAVGSTHLAAGSVTPDKIAAGAILAYTPATLHVWVNPLRKWNGQRISAEFLGQDFDCAPYVPDPGLRRYLLLEINSTGLLETKPGAPTSGTPDRTLITADPDTTALGFIYLEAGQTQVTSAQIFPWLDTYGGAGGAGGAGGSPVGHIHGAGYEARVSAIGLDEAFAHPTATASMGILIEGRGYLDTSGVRRYKAQTLVTGFALPAAGQVRRYGVYLNPASGSYVLTTPIDAPSDPAYPGFTGNQRPSCYVTLPATATIIKAGPDGTNGYIEDAREWTNGGAGISSLPVGPGEGGTGVGGAGFGGSGFVFTPGGTQPFTYFPAATGPTLGLGITPTVTGMTAGADVDMMQLGGGTIANGSTALNSGNGLHIVPPAKQAGAVTTGRTFTADGPTFGSAGNVTGRFLTGVASGVALVLDTVAAPTGNLLEFRNNGALMGYHTASGALVAPGVTSFPSPSAVGQECFRSDLRSRWVCTVAGSPGTWVQTSIGSFATADPPPTGAAVPVGFRYINATDNFQRRYNGSAYVKQSASIETYATVTNIDRTISLAVNTYQAVNSHANLLVAADFSSNSFTVEDANSLIDFDFRFDPGVTAPAVGELAIYVLIDGDTTKRFFITSLELSSIAAASGTAYASGLTGTAHIGLLAAGAHTFTIQYQWTGAATASLVYQPVTYPNFYTSRIAIRETKP